MAIIKCEHCLTSFEYSIRTEGILKRRTITEDPICPYCGKKNNNERRIKCLECGDRRLYSILEGTDNLRCGKCKKELPAVTTIHMECPHCSREADVDINAENYSCLGCKQVLDVHSEVDWIETYAGNRNSVVVRNSSPVGEDYVIWKDKRHSFPYKSRLIVSQAREYALIEKNGILACYKHDDPDFENGFLLGDSLKSRNERLKEALENGDVSTLWLNIYWVNKTITGPESWTEVIDLSVNNGSIEGRTREGNNPEAPRDAIATLIPEISFNLGVIDAKSFFSKIQRDYLEQDKLICLEDRKDTYGKTLHSLVMDAIRECLNRNFNPSHELGFELTKFKGAAEQAINNAFIRNEWGLEVTDFGFKSSLKYHEQASPVLKSAGLSCDLISNSGTLEKLFENYHKELKKEFKSLEDSVEVQVKAIGETLKLELENEFSGIHNKLNSVVNEGRNLGIISAEMADRLAAFQRVENAGLEELRDLNGKINNLRKDFLNYKKESTEQEQASIDRLVQKLDDQQSAVMNRIDALERELSQRADAFSSKLDEFFYSGKKDLSKFLADFKDHFPIIHEQSIDLNKILNTTIVTKEQCNYMGFDDVCMFRSFIEDSQIENDDLERVIAVAFNLAQTGKLDTSNSLDLGNYSPYTFMLGYLYEKLVKRYYHENVFLPFIQEYNNDYYVETYQKKNTDKLEKEGKPWYPDLGHYSSGPRPSWRNWCSRRNRDGNYYPDESIAKALSKKFSISGINYSIPQWTELLRNMVQANAFRNAAAHVSSPITKTEATDFFTLMFKGENSLLRRLIMMRDVTVNP